ncbi:Oligoribonuclease, mitochondrial [Armadillidium nasatum]|uniref:Oligoribonuclease, mitochondrial n=1 Tax=Armadillidium nasatum TaxID=96803 RepID=A0A5N5T6B4_9CRUS|nr:Oligoribonuclease, mitochondrial [Armadillidium nasatum]
MMASRDTSFVFIDMQLTGPFADNDKIMEVCLMVSDKDFDHLELGPMIAIKIQDEILENMNKSLKDTHTHSGLLDACKDSNITLESAEDTIVEFINRIRDRSDATLVTVSENAVNFLKRYMPKVKFCVGQIVVLSTIRELCRIWYPNEYSNYRSSKIGKRAIDNAKEYVNEMTYYKDSVFK